MGSVKKPRSFVLNDRAMRSIIALGVDVGFAARNAAEMPENQMQMTPEILDTCVVQVMRRIAEHQPAKTLLYDGAGDSAVVEH